MKRSEKGREVPGEITHGKLSRISHNLPGNYETKCSKDVEQDLEFNQEYTVLNFLSRNWTRRDFYAGALKSCLHLHPIFKHSIGILTRFLRYHFFLMLYVRVDASVLQ